MKISISFPEFGSTKLIDVEDENKLAMFFDKRITEEVNADVLGDEFKGYVLKITGGFDKQGFPMMNGVLTAKRVRLLLDGSNGFYKPRRTDQKKRRAIRGCIVSRDTSLINCVVTREGENPIEGLTTKDSIIPRALGPKRANKIRKLNGIKPTDDVRPYVLEKIKKREGKKPKVKVPKIQRLITPRKLAHRRYRESLKQKAIRRALEEQKAYRTMMTTYRREKRKEAQLAKKREMQEAGTKPGPKTTPKQSKKGKVCKGHRYRPKRKQHNFKKPAAAQ
mmetsp:Transcript_6072/g.6630  ORF Transcript_6072/g.6630 Transcript_6072/m.6630 type:complete len:278 (-) Transcript_6072:28-861(-)